MTRAGTTSDKRTQGGESGSAGHSLSRLAWFLDSFIPIPGTRMRMGIDSVIGLLPGVGDSLGALLSSFIILQASRVGAPKTLLLRMGFNVAVELLFGAVPILGDLFDIVWKANERNVRLARGYLDNPGQSRRSSRLFAATLGLILVTLAFLLFAGAVWTVNWIAGMVANGGV